MTSVVPNQREVLYLQVESRNRIAQRYSVLVSVFPGDFNADS